MDESLLGRAGGRSNTEEEELLWNELDHHSSPHEDPRPVRGHPGAGYGESENATPRAVPLPSLRAHVHLPAISSLFRDVADSAKARFNGRQAQRPRRISSAPDEHGRVHNVDAFLINLYNYYYHKGFWCIVVVEVVGLLTGLFTVSLSSFALGCVQWSELIKCHKSDKQDCKQRMEDYITCRNSTSFVHMIVGMYFLMFLVYWLSRAIQVIKSLRDAYDMSCFYANRLLIDERQVQTIKWDEVVGRVLDLIGANVPKNLNQISSYRLQIDPAALSTPHDFARRIMRRENYLIACMNHSLFQGDSMLPQALKFASTSEVMFSRNMECNLNICLVDQMFDGDNNLSQAFMQDVQMLQKRFVVAGAINLVLTPFILLYRIFHFFFQSAQEWHTNRVNYFGARRWSSHALWKFREYNELPHVLEARVARSYGMAEKYLSAFPAGPVAVIAGGISFCASSVMAMLIAVSVLEESVLLETTLYNRQLLWYLTIATGMFAISRSFTSSTSPFMAGGDCEEAMMQLSAETHYFPPEWRGRCHSFEVRDAFLVLFPIKAVLFAQECLSVILAPYILCYALPHRAREILLFLRSHTLSLPHAGAVCRFAEFDFKRYGNDMKMESSFVNFKQNHPKWIGAQEGEDLVQRIDRLKVDEMEKSMRLGDTVMFGSGGVAPMMSLCQQLMQSQAIHTALGGQFPPSMLTPQDSQFYWLEKLHQQGHTPFPHVDIEETKDDRSHPSSFSISSLGDR
ncbi:TPA: hypothetical protein N0F65_010737 [Lagenidium giganteum]|uniref:Autophagy-related protein 9 n=1 Tax=Lagenidium giganteum TaxID=4803 RepID=A0AAV2YQU0_9STRA|nr:TPA: hypothetical protein N0F65_010737 [Lagenidium giganteum]